MRWVDIVVLFDSVAALVVGLLLYFTIRKPNKNGPEWALVGLFAAQLTWILSDGLAVFLAVHYGIFSDPHHGVTGIAIVCMVLFAYVFCELYPDWPPARLFETRLSTSVLIALPFLYFVFTPHWVANRRVEGGIKVGDPGPFFLWMGTWALLMVLMGMVMLSLRYRRLRDGRLRRNIRLIGLGIVLNLILSIMASYVLPLLGVPEFDFIGPVAAIVFVSLILYAISFHRLFDIETAAIRLLVNAFTALVFGGALLFLFVWLGDGLHLTAAAATAVLFFVAGVFYAYIVKPRVDGFLQRGPVRSEPELLELLSICATCVWSNSVARSWKRWSRRWAIAPASSWPWTASTGRCWPRAAICARFAGVSRAGSSASSAGGCRRSFCAISTASSCWSAGRDARRCWLPVTRVSWRGSIHGSRA